MRTSTDVEVAQLIRLSQAVMPGKRKGNPTLHQARIRTWVNYLSDLIDARVAKAVNDRLVVTIKSHTHGPPDDRMYPDLANIQPTTDDEPAIEDPYRECWAQLKHWLGQQPARETWPHAVRSQIAFLEDQILAGAPGPSEPLEPVLGVVSPDEPPEDVPEAPGPVTGSSWELQQVMAASSHRQQLRYEAERLLSNIVGVTNGPVASWDWPTLQPLLASARRFLNNPPEWDGKVRP